MNTNALRNIYDAIEIKDMSFDAFVKGYMQAIIPISKGEIKQEITRRDTERMVEAGRNRNKSGIILPN